MAQTAKFGIVTTVDDAAIAKLVKTLMSLPDISKLISKAWDDVAPKVKAATEKVQTIVEEGERKIATTKQQSNERVKQLLTDQVNAQQAAANRIKVIEENAARFTAESDKKTTTELVDHILDLQKKKAIALNASKAAALEGAKAEVAEQKKVIEGYDQELRIITKLSLERKEVKYEGAGAKIGQPGIGRELSGVGGALKRELSGQMQSLASMGPAPLQGITSALAAMGPAGMAAAAGIGVAAVGIGAVIKIGSEFEDSMAELSAITGAEGDTLKGLGDKARELGKEFGTGASSGVEAFKLVVSALGPEVAKDQEAMNEMGRDVMTLAKAAGVDAPQATSVLTNTLNQFGGATLSAKDQAHEMSRIMNVMAAGAKEGAAEIPDLSEAVKVVGTVAHGSKMSIEETTAAIETMSMSGLKGGEAGTGLRNVLLDLSSGTTKSKKSLAELGLTFDQVNPEKVGFTNSLKIMKEHLANVTDATQRAEIMSHVFGKENIASANILISGVEQVKSMTKAVTGTDEAHKQAAIRMATFTEAVKRFGAKLEDIALVIWEKIQPAMKVLGDVLGAVADVLGWLIPKVIDIAAFIFKWLTPLGLLIQAIELLWRIGSKLIGLFIDWVTHLGFVQKAMGWVKTAIADVIEWVTKAYKTITDFIDKVGNVIDSVIGDKKVKVNVTVVPVVAEPDKPLIPEGTVVPEESEADQKKAGAAAKKAAKSLYDAAKEKTEKDYAEARIRLETKHIEEHTLEANAKMELLELEKTHAADKLAVEKKYGKDQSAEKLELLKADAAIRKELQGTVQQDSMLAAKTASEAETKTWQSNLDEQLAALKKYDDEKFAETKKRVDRERAAMVEQVKFFTGPIVQGFSKALNTVFAGVNHITEAWSKSKNIAVSAFGDIASGFVKMLEQMIEKLIAFGVVYEVLNIITGGGAGVVLKSIGLAADIGGAIAGHASGTDNSPGGMFWHGENGPELYIEKPGSMVIPNHQINVGGGGQDFAPMLQALNRSNQLAERQVSHLDNLQRNSAPGYGSSQSLYNLSRGQNQAFKTVNRRQVK